MGIDAEIKASVNADHVLVAYACSN